MSAQQIKHHRQQGSALLISLVILLVLTLVGVSAMDTNLLEEKMSGNMRDQQIAFQSAEAAIYEAEAYIEGITVVSDFTGSGGLLGDLDTEPKYFESATWGSSSSIGVSNTIPDIDSDKQPRYIIKYLGVKLNQTVDWDGGQLGNYGDSNAGDINVFRITARGTGASGKAQAIIQTYYGRRM